MTSQKPSLPVRRLSIRLTGDASRTITRFFWVGNEQRAQRVINCILDMGDTEAAALLDSTLAEFGDRHPDLRSVLTEHYEEVARRTNASIHPAADRRLLIGAYFTMEYSYESAALFNPSMVPAYDQEGVDSGSVRFLMSLRAVGEGHVSSIVFRRGVVDRTGEVRFEPNVPHPRRLRTVEDQQFEQARFRVKLIEMGAYTDRVEDVLNALPDPFTCAQLIEAVERLASETDDGPALWRAADRMIWLARSNYQIRLQEGADISEMVIFPLSEAESQGMEDMRLVRFTDGDGSACYYGTYTASNGAQILPQMVEIDSTTAPLAIDVQTLSGRYAQNKGIALFPRRVDGWYMMIARVDGENLFLARSDNVRFWNEGALIQTPRYPWEFVQIGNCGSPIETEAGWLLLTHGVGPMRRYCMGATLLDIYDPSRIVGQLTEPLLMPITEERSGYVPNVVYSCGAMLHNDMLVIPYGISDAATGFAVVSLADLLDRMTMH